MIRYNFRPSLIDHCQVFVLVRPFYSATDQDLASVNNRLSKFQNAQIQNNKRIVRFKFHKGFLREHYDWGKIQTHRRPVGLIGIARLSPDPKLHGKDMEKIQHRFANVKCQYELMLYDSRCIVLCKNKPDIILPRNFIFVEDSGDVTGEEFVGFMNDFVSTLFVVLESKRVEKGNEKFDKMEMPVAPIEQEQIITESDTRTTKRKCLGRNRKLLADLCLLSGMYQDALFHYAHSSENLRATTDFLWMGTALEGLCATSIIMTKVEVPVPESCIVLQNSGNSNGAQGDLSLDEEKTKVYIPLTDDEIISKYSEVLTCYRKFQAGHVEMEAHLKFIKLLISMKKTLEACQVIQSLLTLPMGYNDSEKVDLCKVISTIFDQVNLKRKAAFFRRRGAMHCTNQNNASLSALKYANNALLKTTDGYMLNMTTHSRQDSSNHRGWSSLQFRILLDMLHVSTRLGDTINCIRLLCFILENYNSHLSEVTRAELINRLEDFETEIEADGNKNVTESAGMIRPLPIVRNFKPRPLAHHLQPKKQRPKSEHGGPFIFSSLSFQARKKKKTEDVVWVCGDVSEVGMTVDNPLPAEIKVKKMILVTEGISFEAFPATLALPAESGSFPFMLLGTPLESGILTIKGYQVDVFGIENTVFLDAPITVNVTPSLPLMRLTTTLPLAMQMTHVNPDDENYQTLFSSFSSYRGHSTEATIKLENAGKIPIRSISVKMKKTTDKSILFDGDVLKSSVPLDPGNSIPWHVTIMPAEAWRLQPSADKVCSTLIFSYSYDEEEKEAYIREISMVIDIKVMPSLSISNYDVYEIDRHQSCCCLCCDVSNHTSIDMKIETFVKETQDIKPREGCPSESVTTIAAKGKRRVGIHFPRCLLSLPNTRMNQKIENVYNKAIKEAVKLHWTHSNSQYGGVTFLADLKCDLMMVNALKPKHLEMKVTTNNYELHEGEELNTKTCTMNHLHIQLTNAHEFDLHGLTLTIDPHQDDEIQRTSNPNLFMHCGTLRKFTRKLSPGEVLDHSCGLFFLYGGEYIVDITCNINKSPVKRERARAIVNSSNQSPFDSVDANENLEVFVDGIVKPLDRNDSMQNTVGKILHKPLFNKWERRFVVNVC